MAVAAAAGVVVVLFMALPFFVESAPRAYRLKAGNAATLLFQHSSGHPHHKAAQVYYQTSLRIAPGEPAVLSNLGLSYALSRNLPEAEQALRQANAHPRADARVRHNLSLVLALQGNFKEAEEIQLKDMPPDQAAANVATIRQMIAQSNTWRDIERQGSQQKKPQAKPKRQAGL